MHRYSCGLLTVDFYVQGMSRDNFTSLDFLWVPAFSVEENIGEGKNMIEGLQLQ